MIAIVRKLGEIFPSREVLFFFLFPFSECIGIGIELRCWKVLFF